MSKPVHHRLDVYGTELHAAFDPRGWAALRRTNPDLPERDGLGLTHDSRERATDRQHLWIYIDIAAPLHQVEGELVDTIAHEATHAAAFTLARCSIPFDDEPFAYLVGWTSAWLWRNIPR